MPYCPKCKYEYRMDVEICPDCDERLVDELPVEQPPEKLELVCIATYLTEVPAQVDRLKLETHGIKSVIKNEVMSQTDIVLAFAEGGVMLMVRKEDAAKARKVLER